MASWTDETASWTDDRMPVPLVAVASTVDERTQTGRGGNIRFLVGLLLMEVIWLSALGAGIWALTRA